MKKPSSFFHKISAPAWGAPLTLLALCVLAYGLLIPWLGYAYDEWHFVYYATIKGSAGLTELFNYDGHPQALWFYLTGFRLLGYNPLAWHIFSLFWKSASVIMFWALLKTIWPARKLQAFTAALIFGLYPLFTLQVFPIAYSEVWFSFFLLFLSFFLTIKAVQQPGKFWQWTILALLAKTACLFTSEYTWFLELLRPVLIWIVLPAALTRTEKLRRSASIWLPYFALFFASVLWRGFFYQPLRKSFQVPLHIFDNPIATLLAAIRYLVPDTGLTLFSSWFQIIKPEYLDFANRTNLIILMVGLAGAAITYLLARSEKTNPAEDEQDHWLPQALLIGAIGLVCGLVPAYVAGYTVYLSEWPGNARFALAAFPGAALVVTALLEIVISRRARWICLAILAGLLIGWQFRVSNDFRQVWDARSKFYPQLTWRMPGIKPNTAIVLANSYLPNLEPGSPAEIAVVPDFSVALSINAIYGAQPGLDGSIPYWYYSTSEFPTSDTDSSQPINLYEEHATLHFSSAPANVIALYFNPNQAECLRVLGPEYAAYAKIPPEIKALAQVSNPQNILVNAQPDFSLLNTIVDQGSQSTWCYLYEKADLAAQNQDWKSVVSLWQQAGQKQLHAANGYENLVFIQALMRTNDWKMAFDLTRETQKINQGISSALCTLWVHPESAATPPTDADHFTAQAINMLQCQK